MYIIQSELINRGFNEFEQKNEIVFLQDDYQFIKKIMKYDEDVQDIVNDKIFLGEGVKSKEGDIHFKKLFLNKFLDRQLKKQTIEGVSAQIIHTFLMYENFINLVYEDLDKFLLGQSETITKGDSKSITDDRRLSSDLPQNEINLNVDDTVLNYGNQNTISRNKNDKKDDSTSISTKYSIDELLKTETLLRNVFNEFDRNCFAQIF